MSHAPLTRVGALTQMQGTSVRYGAPRRANCDFQVKPNRYNAHPTSSSGQRTAAATASAAPMESVTE
jgi:hypothetical protein